MNLLERLEAFAQLYAHELQHPEELGLSAEQKQRFLKLAAIDPHRANLPLRLAWALRQEALEVVQLVERSEGAPTVLDCGCGWGTHAILFAFLGARVVGVELIKDRIDIARARLDWFRSNTPHALQVEFLARNVFSVLREHPCDVVWACQAISHIHPAEDFLDQLYQAMPQGSHVVLSDFNWWNAPARAHLYGQYWRVNRKLHWYSHRKYSDPETGEPVEMAEERAFSPPALARLVRRSGFEVTKVCTRGFIPLFRLSRDGQLARTLAALERLDSVLSRVPLLGQTGTFLVVVGRKGGASS